MKKFLCTLIFLNISGFVSLLAMSLEQKNCDGFVFVQANDFTKKNPDAGLGVRFESKNAKVDEYIYSSAVPASIDHPTVIKHFKNLINVLNLAVERKIYKSFRLNKTFKYKTPDRDFLVAELTITDMKGNVRPSLICLTVKDSSFLKYRITFFQTPSQNDVGDFFKFMQKRAQTAKGASFGKK